MKKSNLRLLPAERLGLTAALFAEVGIYRHLADRELQDLQAVLVEHAAMRTALDHLDLLLDFRSPVGDELPIAFFDVPEINQAFVRARAALVLATPALDMPTTTAEETPDE